MAIPLEDNFNDIIGKAQRGLKLDSAHLATAAGISVAELEQVKAGQFNEAVVRKLAPVLKLGAATLVASGRKSWYPHDPGAIPGLACFNTPYEDMTVNSYLVWDAPTKRAVAFDTGADCDGMLDCIKSNQLKLELVLLTHIHGDHIFDLDRLTEATGATAFVSDREPIAGATPFPDGKPFNIGGLQIDTRRTSGHSRGGVTYVVTGLSRPLAVVGDAMFAGSMGGGMVSYEEALHTNLTNILTLPDDTVLCPGHGPLTTVGEEKQHNPFFTK
jgi:hydroxyacylglutathione hydrolase